MKHPHSNAHRNGFRRLNELGAKMNISFSRHLVTGNTIIGIDGIRKQLLIVQGNLKDTITWLLNLRSLKSVSIKKTYNSIPAGELDTKRFEDFLKSIDLHFEHNDGSDDTVITLYESGFDNAPDLRKLEKMVRNWQSVFSKLIGNVNRDGLMNIPNAQV